MSHSLNFVTLLMKAVDGMRISLHTGKLKSRLLNFFNDALWKSLIYEENWGKPIENKTNKTKRERPKVNIAATARTYETEQMSSSQPPFSLTECVAPTKVPEPGGCTNSPKTDLHSRTQRSVQALHTKRRFLDVARSKMNSFAEVRRREAQEADGASGLRR